MKKEDHAQRQTSTVAKKATAEEIHMERGRRDIKAHGRRLQNRSLEATDEYRQALRTAKSARTPTEILAVAGLLQKAHASGDFRAAYALGTWYFHGKLFDENKKKGFKLMLEAADHFVASACYDVAVSYELGDGVKKNVKKAVVYYLRAMMLGDQQAITEFGRLFYWGIGVPKHRGIAKELLNFRPE